jgi:hypothetical protein
MPDRIPTSEKLARALEQAGAPSGMIEAARLYYYDDYKGHSANNINELVRDAQAAGLPGIVLAAKAGDFDGQKWEADEWARSTEGQETFAALMPSMPRGPRKPYKRKRANPGKA